MPFPPYRIAVLALAMLAAVAGARAGGDDTLGFIRTFLERNPYFRAEGVMTTTLAGGAPSYRCRVEINFKKGEFAKFLYNTDGARNIIPYDELYEEKRLSETIYNRDRTMVLSIRDVGMPMRTIFGFVWDLLDEAEHGSGLRSFLFNGLMSVQEIDQPHRTQVVMERRLPGIPVKKVLFVFDDAYRLRSLQIFQSDGTVHRIEIRRFRTVTIDGAVRSPIEIPEDLARPQIGPPAPGAASAANQ